MRLNVTKVSAGLSAAKSMTQNTACACLSADYNHLGIPAAYVVHLVSLCVTFLVVRHRRPVVMSYGAILRVSCVAAACPPAVRSYSAC